MKIAFIGGRDVKSVGGIENYMLNLATQMVRLGHEPIVFCESDHNGEECVNGFRVIHMTGPRNNLICKPWVGLKATLKVIFGIKGVDFIHYNAWPPSLWSPLARLFGIRSLMQGHGLEWQRSKYSPQAQKVMRFMERVTAHLNRNLIMCSQDQVRYFKERYGRDAVCIPTAINIPQTSSDTMILDQFGLEEGKYFLFLARLVQDKNPDYLIKGFMKAAPKGYKLVIAGNNPADPGYVESLHKLADGNESVVFTDGVFGADKETLLRHAYAFCIPSTIEGLSISLLEAMSRRIPIIASDIPANREVLDEGEALWVRTENADDIAKAVSKAVDDPAAFRVPIESNYQRVAQTYTWERVAEKYIGHLRTIIKEG